MVDRKASTSTDGKAGPEYEIKIKGYLDENWSDWLGGLKIAQDEQGYSHLTGIIPDQAALHGILNQIRDLGLTLISITSKGTDDKTSEDKSKRRQSR